jgi:hypothetical protein
MLIVLNCRRAEERAGSAASLMDADLSVAIVLRKANTGPPGRVARYNSCHFAVSSGIFLNPLNDTNRYRLFRRLIVWTFVRR